MARRSTFLLGSGAVLIGESARGAAASIYAPNIIIPGRFGTAYLANLPLWTPKEALHNPITAQLNRIPRYTRQTLSTNRNLAEAMMSKVMPNP